MIPRATPDELDRRASLARGWKADLLRKLAAEARERPAPEITTTYRVTKC
jgi:hypothetical protein